MNTTNKEQLKKEILQAVQSGDIAKLYMLEQKVNDTFDEKTVLDYYKNILDLAIERLTDILDIESLSKFKMSDVQDFATVRALYEYAMEHYHAGKKDDASALFEILSGVTDDEKFSKAMQIHTIAAQKGIDLDTFLEKYVDMSAVENSGNFYISDFTKEAETLSKESI
ncbi:hypothetical protein MNB_SM-7-446 [hydrothermal vent metagenome]|uniref:Uncharacterized protein n=1 Tax=hydrothermal vent metagenome TaxID=652676 RepID=A0A1W1BTA7_9ZZZZ